ncbi:MAG: ABA4-like family protein [Verrucomicrobiota bacterium]
MNPEVIFQIANTSALLVWIYLFAAARWTPKLFICVRWGFPIALSILYLGMVLGGEKPDEANFTSLEGVSALFTTPRGVVAAWIHFLVFDFFVGCWILVTSKKEGIAHPLILVPLLFTFLFGPAGLLLFLILLGVCRWRKKGNETLNLDARPEGH